MRFVLPTQHVLYFGIQTKKGKLDAAGATKASNANISEIYNQVLMMLGHEIFDPEINRRVLIDHAFIVAGGEITKQARNWLGNKLDASKRSQIMFMDREDILNLFVVANIPLPESALPQEQFRSSVMICLFEQPEKHNQSLYRTQKSLRQRALSLCAKNHLTSLSVCITFCITEVAK